MSSSKFKGVIDEAKIFTRALTDQEIFYEYAGDSWPMVHHDLRHTGTSISSAPNANTILWTYTTGGAIYSSPAVADGKIFFGSWDRNVYALDATTGAKIWNYTTGSFISSSPAVAYGKVYIGSQDGKMYALNENTGTLNWSFSTIWGTFIDSSPAVADGVVYFGSEYDDDKVYALNASNGALLWIALSHQGSWHSSPAVADGMVFIGSWRYFNSAVYAVNQATGALIRTYPTNEWDGISTPTVVNGRIFVGGNSGILYVFDEFSGTSLWNVSLGYQATPAPAVVRGRVFTGSTGTSALVALDEATGTILWNFTTGGRVVSSAAVADGKIFFGSYDGKLYALDETNGALLWSYVTGGSIWSSPAVADGRVYVGSLDGKLYAFESNATWERPPFLMPAENQQALEWGLLTIDINASDPNNDLLTYSTDAGNVLPSPSLFDQNTGLFSWHPTGSDAGTYNVTFNVTDGQLWDSETVLFTVISNDYAPTLAHIGGKVAREGQTVTIALNATDRDNNTLTFSTDAGNALLTPFLFDNQTGIFSWTPTYWDAGLYNITFSVTDSISWDSERIFVLVRNVHMPYEDCVVNAGENGQVDISLACIKGP